MRNITYSFSTLDSLIILYSYLTLDIPKLEQASTVWNSIKSTEAIKLERIQRKLVALCQYIFFTYDHATYEEFLKFLKFIPSTIEEFTLKHYFFFISVYSGLKVCGAFWILLVFEFLLIISELLPVCCYLQKLKRI